MKHVYTWYLWLWKESTVRNKNKIRLCRLPNVRRTRGLASRERCVVAPYVAGLRDRVCSRRYTLGGRLSRKSRACVWRKSWKQANKKNNRANKNIELSSYRGAFCTAIVVVDDVSRIHWCLPGKTGVSPDSSQKSGLPMVGGWLPSWRGYLINLCAALP